MDWDKYIKNFKKKGRWGQWKEWNRLSLEERDYIASMYSITPPPPPNGLLARVGSWPTSSLLGLWSAVGVAFLVSLVLTAQHTSGVGSQFDLPRALSWWLIGLIPGLILTWIWMRAQELKKE